MQDARAYLRGTGPAPLVAAQLYDFHRIVTAAGEAKLTIPYKQRGSWDDHGVVEYADQETFVEELLVSLGVVANGGYPGEWIFADVAALDRVWAALVVTIVPATR